MWASLNRGDGNLPTQLNKLGYAGGSALSYEKVLQKKLLAVWNADRLWLHQPEVKLRKIHVEADTVFQQCMFWVLKEQSQHS